MKRVLIIVPTFNEAENIGPLYAAVANAFAHMPLLTAYTYDLLFVDSSSPDHTARVINNLRQSHSNVYLLEGAKRGLGQAYILGLTYGLKLKSYHAVVTMDADLSHAPRYIPSLLEEIRAGADYVIGSRYVSDGKTTGWPVSRRLISRGANSIAHRLAGISREVQDSTSGFRAIRPAALKAISLNSLSARGYIFQVSLLKALQDKGFRGNEVPIVFTNRRYGTSKLTLRDMAEFLYRAYRLNPNGSVQHFCRFALVGLSGALVNFVVLLLLTKEAHITPVTADAMAIECSIISNFILNQAYTFRARTRNQTLGQKPLSRVWLVNLSKYNAAALGGALVSFLVFVLIYKSANMGYIMANLIAIISGTSWNYWMSIRFVWKPAP